MQKPKGLIFSGISVGDRFRVRSDSGCGTILFEKVTSRSAVDTATGKRHRISGYRRVKRDLGAPLLAGIADATHESDCSRE